MIRWDYFITAALVLVLMLFSVPARADPCKAIPDKGPMPTWLHRGAVFSGPVVYVGDGDSLCVDVAGWTILPPLSRPPERTSWAEIRIANFYAPELHEPGGEAAKEALERIAMGKVAACAAQHQSYDRVVATCMIEGRDVGEAMRGAGVVENGRGR